MSLTWLSSLGARIMLDLGMGLILLLDPKRLDQTLLSDLGAGLTLLPDSSILGLCLDLTLLLNSCFLDLTKN